MCIAPLMRLARTLALFVPLSCCAISLGAERQTTTRTVAAVIVELDGVESGLSTKIVADLLIGSQGVSERLYTSSAGNLRLLPAGGVKKFVFGPVVINKKRGESCAKDYKNWSLRAVQRLGALGRRLSKADHVVYFFPPAALLGCPFFGQAELGSTQSWVFTALPDTVVHEIGHNLGLGHSASVIETSKWSEYGDPSSPMGMLHQLTSMFNAPQLAQLKWIADRNVRVVSSVGKFEFDLVPLEDLSKLGAASDTAVMVKVITPEPRLTFVISFRNLVAPNQPGMPIFQRGVSIHRDRGLLRETVLLKTLTDAGTFFDVNTRLRITQVGHDVHHARIIISLPANELFDAPAATALPIDDPDNDGVLTALDCAPSDSRRWNDMVARDADEDGLADESVRSGLCIGDHLPDGFAYLDGRLDNCPGTRSLDLRDANWDGRGDICTSAFGAEFQRYVGPARARQALSSLRVVRKLLGRVGVEAALMDARRRVGRLKVYFKGDKNLKMLRKELEKAYKRPDQRAKLIGSAIGYCAKMAGVQRSSRSRRHPVLFQSGASQSVLPCALGMADSIS